VSIRYWTDDENDLITIEFRDHVDVCDIASQILHIHGDPACKGYARRLVDARGATVSGAISAFRALVDLFIWQIKDLGTERIAILVDEKTNMDWALSLLKLIGPSVAYVAICHSETEAGDFLGVPVGLPCSSLPTR
jgi:hypothetical protein